MGSYSGQKSTSKKHKKHTKRTTVILVIVLLLLICGGVYLYSRSQIILNNPGDLFDEASLPTATAEANTQSSAESVELTPEPEKTETETAEKKGITNILLLGIDRTTDGGTSSGTMPHADAVMVIAVNFDENTVNLVSLPRDSFVNMPTVKGFYKLNCMFNVGGGYDAPNDEGFLMMCRAAEWMLGGISVDYYYSVDFEAVIELVDALGGVDYDMDMAYTGNSGRHYAVGMQHLDGQGVLDYLRARKNATNVASDRGRVNRQKEMMIAIFNKIKKSNLLSTIPQLLSTVKEGFYTNTTAEQTLALANYARKIDQSTIGTYSLYGDYKAGPIAWNWTFVDPDNRIAVIQEVWGITVTPLECTSYEFMSWLNDYGFSALKYLSTAEDVGNYATQLGTLNSDQNNAYLAYSEAYAALKQAYDLAAHSLSSDDTQTVEDAKIVLKEKTELLSELIAYNQKLHWTVGSSWCADTGINEIYVDFR